MKRRILLKKLARQARIDGLDIVITEGGSHTKVSIGDRRSVIPRHSEINEITAQAILRHMGVER